MTIRLALAAAIACVLAVAAAPQRAAAGSYGGRLGLRYDRAQAWTPSGESLLTPSLSLDGSAGAEGYIYARDLLSWTGNLSYLGSRDGTDLGNTTNSLGYGLGLGLFQSGESRTPLSVFASRSTSDSALDFGNDGRLTGTTTSTGYGATGGLNLPGRPFLRALASRIEETNSGFGREATNQTTDTFSAGLRHGVGPYELDVGYDGRFRTSNIPFSNFDEHTVRLVGNAAVAPRVSAYASDLYQQRAATTNDATNPTSLNNSFQAGVRGVSADNANRWYVAYDYSHFFVEAPTVERSEQFSHGVTGQSDQTHTEHLSSRVFASANLSDLRLGTSQQLASGESLGASGIWTQALRPGNILLVEAGPTVGALQPQSGSAQLAYGGLARVKWTLEELRSDLEYSIVWSTNLAAIQGTTLTQRLRFDYSHRLSRTSRLTAYAAADATRLENDLLGTSVGQSGQAEGVLWWGRERHSLRLGGTYSAGPTLFSSGTIRDGLFIPPDFSNRTATAYLAYGSAFTSRLTFSASVRYGGGSGTAIPTQRELGVTGSIGYALGLLSLSVDDLYTAGGSTALDNRANYFFVRLTRAFGGRF
jgi:hypothetical protein